MKKTRIAALVVSACLLAGESSGAASASAASKKEPISVWVGSEQVAFDVSPVIVKGVTYVEFKGLFKALGYQLSYDAAGKIIKGASASGTVITLNTVTGQATVDGKAASQTAKPIITNGRTLVPLRFVAEATGYNVVRWDASAQKIVLTAKPDPKSVVIATYTGGQVTEDEFNRFAAFYSLLDQSYMADSDNPEARARFLKEYIGYKVLASRASDEDRANADKDTALFLEQYNQAIAYNPELKAQAEQAGLTIDNVRGYYYQLASIRHYWQSGVTEAVLRDEYLKNADSYSIVSVRHILIAKTDPNSGAARSDEEALRLANEARQKLMAGGDWNKLAAEYSEDPGSKDNGGLYDNAMPVYWVEEFKQAAIKQPIGVIGEPIRTAYGYHVVEVITREARTYEQMNEEIKGMLRSTIINAKMTDFMANELPTLIQTIELPKG